MFVLPFAEVGVIMHIIQRWATVPLQLNLGSEVITKLWMNITNSLVFRKFIKEKKKY
jgi:hypothetical protein